MKRLVLATLAAALLIGHVAMAQDGVLIDYSGGTRDNSAVLDVRSADQGVLVPRVNIADVNTAAPVTSPAQGLLVYNTNAGTGVGYYYWTGSAWVRLMSGNTPPLLTETDPTWSGAANTTGAVSRTGTVTIGNRLTLNSAGFDEHLLIQRTGAPDGHFSTSTGGWVQIWPGLSGDYTTKGIRLNNTGSVQLMNYTANGIVRTTGGNGTLSSTGGGINLSSEVTGVLPVANGGTGIGTLTGVVVGNGTAAMSAVAGTGSQFLRRNAANTAYEFVALTPSVVGMSNLTFDNSGSGAASGTIYNGGTAQTISYNTIGAVGGTGTANYVTRWTGANTLGNGIIQDNGSRIGIGTAPHASYRVQSAGDILLTSGWLRTTGSTGWYNETHGGGVVHAGRHMDQEL